MDTSLTVRNMRRQSWALMLREQSASGLSVKDWCNRVKEQEIRLVSGKSGKGV